MDFTGTLAETVDMQKGRYTDLVEEKYKLFKELYKTFTKGGLICCSIEVCTHQNYSLLTFGGGDHDSVEHDPNPGNPRQATVKLRKLTIDTEPWCRG